MADDGYRKPFRSDDSFGRTTGVSPSSGASAPASDPLAELARLIGQTDPFAEFGRTQRAASSMPAEPVAPAPRSLPQFEPPHYAQAGQADHYDTPQYGLPFGAQPNSQADYGQGVPGQLPPGQSYAEGPGYDPAMFAQDHMQAGQDAYYDDVPPPRRRLSVLAIAGVFALAVVGTAGALGYRAMFGSSGSAPPPVIKADTAPSKVVPPAATAQSNKLINDRIGEKIQSEKLVSREEQPVDLAKQTLQTAMTGGANAATPQPAPAGNGLYEPKKVKTIAIRPDQPANGAETTASAARSAAEILAPQAPATHAPVPRSAPMPLAAQEEARPQTHAAAPAPRHSAANNAPLSLTPGANAPQAAPAPAAPPRAVAPQRTASAPASSNGSGGYAVQISSQRSEADAQTAFRNMQGRYPSQLGGKQVMIRRADLGSKGVYYRAMVGPFANAGDATELCNSLKAAGGQCIVQKI
jgi:hypothetical protein